MKRVSILLAAALMLLSLQPASAQLNSLLRSLGNKATGALQNEARKGVQQSAQHLNQEKASAAQAEAASRVVAGKTLYVSISTGSARADGLSPSTAMKDLQKIR